MEILLDLLNSVSSLFSTLNMAFNQFGFFAMFGGFVVFILMMAGLDFITAPITKPAKRGLAKVAGKAYTVTKPITDPIRRVLVKIITVDKKEQV